MSISNEPVSDIDASGVKSMLINGAELWFAGSSGGRATLLDRDQTILVSPEVLEELTASSQIVVVSKVGSIIQYGLPEPVASH